MQEGQVLRKVRHSCFPFDYVCLPDSGSVAHLSPPQRGQNHSAHPLEIVTDPSLEP
jgi:hypothetical protein